MQNDKRYFVPNIEELIVGWEGEKFSYLDGKWDKFTASKFDLLWILDEEEDDCYEHHIRGIYLTQEQIEAEGWTSYITEYKGEIRLENMNFIFFKESSNYMLKWFFNKQQIGLLVKDPVKALDENGNIIDYDVTPRYTGECKDINTFRYICKLLKI